MLATDGHAVATRCKMIAAAVGGRGVAASWAAWHIGQAGTVCGCDLPGSGVRGVDPSLLPQIGISKGTSAIADIGSRAAKL